MKSEIKPCNCKDNKIDKDNKNTLWNKIEDIIIFILGVIIMLIVIIPYSIYSLVMKKNIKIKLLDTKKWQTKHIE